jgi:hypothetical protein
MMKSGDGMQQAWRPSEGTMKYLARKADAGIVRAREER